MSLCDSSADSLWSYKNLLERVLVSGISSSSFNFRLQKFKLNIANTIVNQENSGLASMATDQLLDLFSTEGHHAESSSQKANSVNPSKGLKAMLQDMTALWDESEYETEYNVTNFLASLGKK